MNYNNILNNMNDDARKVWTFCNNLMREFSKKNNLGNHTVFWIPGQSGLKRFEVDLVLHIVVAIQESFK